MVYISKAQRERYENEIESEHGAQPGNAEEPLPALGNGEEPPPANTGNREEPPPAHPPVYVGTIAGLPYVWVYANPTVPRLTEALDAVVAPGDVLVVGGETAFARSYGGRHPLVEFWGHWDVQDVRGEVERSFPADWRRAWVVRYPDHDPDAVVRALDGISERVGALSVDDGVIEITEFVRR